MLAKLFLLLTFGAVFALTAHFSGKTIFSTSSFHNFLARFKVNSFSLDTSVNAKSKEQLPRSLSIKNPDSYIAIREGLRAEEISAEAGLVYGFKDDKIIFAKNLHTKHAIASLTKVATFLVAVENVSLDTLMIVSEHAASQEPDSMGLFPGERLTLKQLLTGLILVSGNDSAEVVAENTLGPNSRDAFIEKMNAKAYYLGMDNTLFKNPSGLDVEGGSGQSTPYDLLLLAKEAMKSPVFAEISSQRNVSINEVFSESENHKGFDLINTSPTIDYPGYVAGKPGFTYDAGKCQITVVEQNGEKYMAIILGSSDRKTDTEKMFNWAYALQ